MTKTGNASLVVIIKNLAAPEAPARVAFCAIRNPLVNIAANYIHRHAKIINAMAGISQLTMNAVILSKITLDLIFLFVRKPNRVIPII